MAKNLKIAFVQSEVRFKPLNALGTYPLGILYLATTVKQKTGYDVKCFEEDSEPILKNGKIHPFLLEADVVGISGLTSTIPRTYAIADELRNLRAGGKTNKNLQVMIGGMHATFMPQEAVEHADVVVRGECEGNIVDLIESKQRGIVQGKRVEDLDSLVDPDYSLLDYKKRRLADFLHGNLASVSTSRGCSYCCDFCSVWTAFGRKVRIESPERQVDKLRKLREQGFKRVFIHDDNFSEKRVHRKALFDILINENLDMNYTVQDRIDLLQDEEYVEMMARSGCSMVMFSIESPNEEFLRMHNKQLDLGKVEKGVKLLRKNKIAPYAFCMIEPENLEQTEQTIKLLRDLRIKYAQFTILTLLPGSILYNKLKDKISVELKNRASVGWEYFTGLSLVTESKEKIKTAGEHLSKTWRKFYSPARASLDIFLDIFKGDIKGNISRAGLRLYGWYVGRQILKIQPDL